MKRSIYYIFSGLVVIVFCWWGVSTWQDRNQLVKYGVSYEKTCGEHVEYQTIQFFWNRNRKRIHGPMVTGDELYVRFKHANHSDVPIIIVHSDTYKSNFIVFKLNFSDPRKPEFEMIENNMLVAEYPPPWTDYYPREEGTGRQLPHASHK